MKVKDLELENTPVHLFVPTPYKTTPASYPVNIVCVKKLKHGLV